MSVISELTYPVTLGKSEINSIEIPKGEIKLGRWANVEEEIGKPAKWERVKSWGSIIDRSVDESPSASSPKELGVLTKYENPLDGRPNYELLPLDSELFDIQYEPQEEDSEKYTEVNIATNPKKLKPVENISANTPLINMGAIFATGVITAAGLFTFAKKVLGPEETE